MLLAVGHAEIVGVALLTVTLTDPETVLLSVESVGAKVTDCEAVPAPGAVLGVVNAKLPPTDAEPPDKFEEASVWP
jgi:hypothetical protein